MKYTALYWAMRYTEIVPNVFEKTYSDGTKLTIQAAEQQVQYSGKKILSLDTHESFVELECLDRLMRLGVPFHSIGLQDNSLIYCGYKIAFLVWDDAFVLSEMQEKTVLYKSRLVSGVLEYQSKIKQNGEVFDYGIFENATITELRKKTKITYDVPDFVIEENRVMKYVGKSAIVVVPEGIEEIESCAFWDNQFIEEVHLPTTLKNMGGDTFYYCKNLRSVNIPVNANMMGNNPFAGCPLVEVKNESSHFVMKDGVLLTADMQTLIYCSIKGEAREYVVPDGVKVITKHAFYCCDRLERITLPASLEKMENNPFSGCSRLELINHSSHYYIKDDVIYNGFKTAVIGALNRIKSERLELLDGIKSINRNSFWNCKGINTIVLPASLEDIGYNPFVGCDNIHFESHSSYFQVKDGILYNRDKTKLICCPRWDAKGAICLPDSVITLERGAFSGCSDMTAIHLHNVNIVNKSCFTNCTALESVYCADWLTYVGEWAFAYCLALREVSVRKGTIVDNNALSNCPAKLIEREVATSYLVESDNIYTLRSLQKAYKGKIDSILIDPPYNSHIDYIGYKDGDYEDGYLAFMEERLLLAYPLLSARGFLVINIDEGEVERLRMLCISLFEEELVAVHRWKKKHPFFDANRVVLNPNKKQTDYEYIIICRKSPAAALKQIRQPYIENGELLEKDSSVPETFDCFGTTSSAKDEIQEIFGKRDYFSTPKPVKLMKELIRATTDKDSIIMDFFAGSGTVGQACNEINKEDGGDRHFILVCNNESNICREITAKRLQVVNANYVFIA